MTTIRRTEGRFLAALRQLLDPGDRSGFLIALSGGCDSTALLCLALATAGRHGHRIVAGHVNHGVRSDADSEECRLRDFCVARSIPFRVHRLELASTLGRTPSEAEMREARYRALTRLATSAGCAWILLGHQRDDDAETFLLHLARGAGLRGLAGIPPRRGRFLRPLLGFSRDELARYLSGSGIAWSEDPTNLDLGPARNRVRRVIIPALDRDLRPGAARAIARAAGHLRRALDALEAEARRALERSAQPASTGEIRLDAEALRSCSEGLAEIVLQLAVARVRGSTREIPAAVWGGMLGAVRGRRSALIDMPGGGRVEITLRAILVTADSSRIPGSVEIPVGWRSEARWPAGGGFRASRLRRVEAAGRIQIRNLTRLQAFAPELIRPPFVLRTPRAGDRLVIEDGTGSRSLADLLSERGLPSAPREAQPVLADAEGVLWAPGIRRAARAMIRPGAERIWVVRWFGPLPVDRAPKGGMSK